MERSVTCTAPVNIATVKYWGKRDEKLILPVNSSLSATLNQDDLKTETTITLSSDYSDDEIWLNGEQTDIKNVRLQNCLNAIRALVSDEKLAACKVHIKSHNNFPTAAGLASSAAGYACLAFALAQVYGVKEAYEGQLSTIARIGSGSACRSLYGGFVRWTRGIKEDGSDSFASQVVPETHWPNMRIFVLVVNDQKKEYSSTSGQRTSVETSDLLTHRANSLVEKRMQAMEKAIQERDFAAFGQLTMQDSNQFHAICLDTYPPIFYMNSTSHSIIRLVTNFNKERGAVQAAYTFDAGPNAVLFVEEQNASLLAACIRRAFPGPSNMPGEEYFPKFEDAQVDDSFFQSLHCAPQPGALKYIINTTVGGGPRVVKNEK